MREGLLELAYENARLEALHVYWEAKQLKVRLSLAFAKLPQQNSFEVFTVDRQ
jgi:hypothetical protein